LWDQGADELERLQKKRKKKNPDEGFSGEQFEIMHCATSHFIQDG